MSRHVFSCNKCGTFNRRSGEAFSFVRCDCGELLKVKKAVMMSQGYLLLSIEKKGEKVL